MTTREAEFAKLKTLECLREAIEDFGIDTQPITIGRLKLILDNAVEKAEKSHRIVGNNDLIEDNDL